MNLLIFGASARAAAFSALRAGLQPWCADLFGDADLRARCSAFAIAPRSYPEGFEEAAQWGPPGPWMYTGGLENHPDLVERMARTRVLWGNPANVVRSVRDPGLLDIVFQRYDLPRPAIRFHLRFLSPTHRWLRKPWAGAGGTGIRFCTVEKEAEPSSREVYYQEFIEGESASALYVGEGNRCRLLGATHQLVGENWLHAAPFHYCGSVGPLSLGGALRQSLERVGMALVEALQLCGLFGMDYVLRDGIPYPVEVNPRYTASVEVLEHGLGVPTLSLHRSVFDLSTAPPSAGPTVPAVGKAILFARAALTFPDDGPWMTTLRQPGDVWELPAFADIPAAGTPIQEGRPILTFFARAASVSACQEALQHIAADLDHWLFQ